MARPEKVARVEAIAGHLAKAQSIVMADFTGMTVEQMTLFRAKCREQGVVCKVVKNRLARIAADQVDLNILVEHLAGPTALLMDPESQVNPAKIVTDFAKDNEKLQVKGAILDGRFLDPNQVSALAKIPGRDELIAKMMGSMNSPLTGVCGTINGVMGALARALDAVAKQKAA